MAGRIRQSADPWHEDHCCGWWTSPVWQQACV